MVLIPHLLFCVYHWALLYLIFFARRYIAKDRQKFLQKELEERKARGKFIEW